MLLFLLLINYKNDGFQIKNMFQENENKIEDFDSVNKIEIISIDFNYKTTDNEYRDRVVEYLKKWKNGLEKGIPALKIYPTLLDETHELLLMEHRIYPLSNTKRKIPLLKILNCANPEYSSFLTSKSRENQIKIIDVFPFTYEFSLLEMRLYELYDVVDEFVIFESNLTQKKIYKPLFLTQNIQKFSIFLDKITLMTPFNITRFNKDGTKKPVIQIKDEDILSEFKTSERIPKTMMENNETEYLKIDNSFEYKFRESIFNLYSTYIRKFDENNDLLIHGDLDEIPSSNIIQHFKYCQVKDDLYPFSFWSTFYVYKFKYLFKSDFPAPGDTFSLTFPNIFRYKDSKRLNKIRFENGFVLPKASGAHCNRFCGFITDLYKAVSISDGFGFNKLHYKILKNGTLEGFNEIKKIFENGTINSKLTDRVVLLDSVKSQLNIFVPWIVEENRNSYSRFF